MLVVPDEQREVEPSGRRRRGLWRWAKRFTPVVFILDWLGRILDASWVLAVFAGAAVTVIGVLRPWLEMSLPYQVMLVVGATWTAFSFYMYFRQRSRSRTPEVQPSTTATAPGADGADRPLVGSEPNGARRWRHRGPRSPSLSEREWIDMDLPQSTRAPWQHSFRRGTVRLDGRLRSVRLHVVRPEGDQGRLIFCRVERGPTRWLVATTPLSSVPVLAEQGADVEEYDVEFPGEFPPAMEHSETVRPGTYRYVWVADYGLLGRPSPLIVAEGTFTV